MLKDLVSSNHSPLPLDITARERLIAVLRTVPFLTVAPTREEPGALSATDFTLDIDAAGETWTLVGEVKSEAQPRHVRGAIYQLRQQLVALPHARRAYGILIAPYFSEESMTMLRKESMGYLDLAGNCFLSFGTVFIERRGGPNPFKRSQGLRELFAPKASRVLRILLRNPARPWRLTDLAQTAGVSLGQASNVRRALLDREWASVVAQGLQLNNPGALLDAWRGEYKPHTLYETHYYTLLHGEALLSALREVFAQPGTMHHLLLSSFSAAGWMAPFARVPGQFFYADMQGDVALQGALKLEPAPRGPNVTVIHPRDDGVFVDAQHVGQGLWSTAPVQTYLDLSVSGNRGREAADHLRREMIEPSWHLP